MYLPMAGGMALCVVPLCTGCAMFCCMFGVSGLAESYSGSQNCCVGLLAGKRETARAG